MMKAGQLSYIPGVGHVRVTKVEEVDPKNLTDEDARADGFETADQLRAELAALYPKKLEQGGRSAYRVVFYVMDKEAEE